MNAQADPYSSQTSKRRNLIAGAFIFAALLVGFSLGNGGNLFAIGRSPNAVAATQALGGSPSPVLPSLGEAPPPVLLDEHVQGPKMPDEVRLWLLHLERIERRRITMSSQQIGEAVVKMTMLQGAGGTQQVIQGLLGGDADVLDTPPPTESVSEDTSSQKAAWDQLSTDYESLPPPAECVPLANSYRQTLNQTRAMMNEVLGALAKSATDPQGALSVLYGMQGQSASRIDAAASQSNTTLGQVCAKYNERPWFTIQTDAKGGMLGNVSLPNLGPGGGGSSDEPQSGGGRSLTPDFPLGQ
ncbi:MAG: hypothetical protein KF812_11550 [Fimbriimonadaceae bacterium]|nr:hypothetical protein [Fimbriimonadaceae bacterium]